jgi:hypothetical protein
MKWDDNSDKENSMANAQNENQKEKEPKVSEKEPRIKRWPIIPLIGGPVGILILLCYVTTAKTPAPVKPSEFADVNEQVLLNEAEKLKSQAEQLYPIAAREDDFKKKNELCDKGLDLCDKALEKFDRIRGAYEEQEAKGLIRKGAIYQWEKSLEETVELRKRFEDMRGFPQ